MSDRAWTLLLTGEENGIVGGPGRTFEKHPAHYERVTVIERDPALARIAELEKAALAVVEAERQDSNVGLYLERAVDALAALLGGGE